jgi:hypothetical protein
MPISIHHILRRRSAAPESKVSDQVEEEETMVEGQALGHVVAIDFALPRSGAHRRASLPLTTASPPPPRLRLGRHGAYTIP